MMMLFISNGPWAQFWNSGLVIKLVIVFCRIGGIPKHKILNLLCDVQEMKNASLYQTY
jgi:hypothetical protein